MCSPNQVILHKRHTTTTSHHPRKQKGVTLQRHTTLPGPLRSLPSFTAKVKKHTLHHNKKNPYVGWFRHAPPVTTNKRRCFLLATPRTPLARTATTVTTLGWSPARLRGGVVPWFLEEHEKPSLAAATTVPLSDAEDTLDDDDETATFCDDDDDDASSIRSETRLDLLYAVDHNDRLDYDITQMDIVRMNRVASRHLDVESIANLPVVTYRGQQRKTQGESSKAFSWMLVHSDSETSDNDDTDDNNDTDDTPVCIICCEDFCPGDRLRVLPCSHSFHTGCIDRWLSGSHSTQDCFTAGCPTCKKRIPTQSYFRVGDALASESFVA